MGYYINQDSKGNNLPNNGKLKALINDGAIIVYPKTFTENLVCVIENGMFDAAAYMYSENEFEEFKNDRSGRKKTFIVYPYAKNAK